MRRVTTVKGSSGGVDVKVAIHINNRALLTRSEMATMRKVAARKAVELMASIPYTDFGVDNVKIT